MINKNKENEFGSAIQGHRSNSMVQIVDQTVNCEQSHKNTGSLNRNSSRNSTEKTGNMTNRR